MGRFWLLEVSGKQTLFLLSFFVLAMDQLSRLINVAEEKGLVAGVSLGNNKTSLTHLMFSLRAYLSNFLHIIKAFEIFLGIKINLSKSTITGINIQEQRIQEVALSWGCSNQHLPITYLGVPLGGMPSSVSFQLPIMEKIQKKLEKWCYTYISKGGRTTLIHSTLSNLPNYMLSVFNTPVSICKNIEKAIRNFLWHGTDFSQGNILVKWDFVAAPKSQGGLCIFRIKDTNKALLKKWLWRFCHEDNAVWKNFIADKYESPHFGSIPRTSKFSSSRSLWWAISKLKDIFLLNTRWDVHNGCNISLWHDSWTIHGPLKMAANRKFVLSYKQDMLVSDAWSSTLCRWDLYPRRPLLERELIFWKSFSDSFPI